MFIVVGFVVWVVVGCMMDVMGVLLFCGCLGDVLINLILCVVWILVVVVLLVVVVVC